MPSDSFLRKLIDGGFLKEHPKDADQAKKLLLPTRSPIWPCFGPDAL